MDGELHEVLIRISDRLARIETKLEETDRDRARHESLARRVAKLESFQMKIVGAIIASGALGGAVGALAPVFLGMLGSS